MTDPPADLVSALAARYTVQRELGRGGMATVYLADDLKHHRPVAIKVLHPDLAAALGPERFLREIEVTAKLTHPHILPLYDSGQTGGLADRPTDEFLYYVMPYVAGESLRQRLQREQQLPIEEALQIAREVGDALGYAHSYGIVHRDIKPENILLQAGHAVVADFGIARAIAEAGGEQLTATGIAVGTPAYMSPEQSTGMDQIDGRSDLYALGCVLYEMLAGEPPFTGPTPQAVFAKRLSEPVPHVSTVRETIPDHVEQAITTALAKTPADRYSTTAEFLAALTAPTTDLRRRAPRRRTVLALPAVVVIGVVAAVVVPHLVRSTIGIERLAVLPCANQLDDSTQDYIAAGVHDELVTGLGQIAAVEVRGRRSVLRYRDTPMSHPAIAQDLGVEGLVECAVYRVGDSIWVSAALHDAPHDRQLWADTYRRAAGDVFLLGGDVARGVVDALDATVTAAERARVAIRPTENQEALAHYHRGRHLTDTWTPEGIRAGTEHFERAIALDADFALAYTGLADAIMLRGDAVGTGDIRPVDYMPRARELVMRALALDSTAADAHRMLGWIRFYYDYDYADGERELRRATELDPSSAAAWDYHAILLAFTGRYEEADAAARRAVELDPAAPWIINDFSAIQFMLGEYEEALDAANAAIALDSTLANAYALVGSALFRLGNRDESVPWYERAWAMSGNPLNLGVLGAIYAHTGNRDGALKVLSQLREMGQRRYVSPRAFANVLLGLDSVDAAMEWLIRAAETRDPSLQWDIRTLSRRLQEHARYPELLRLMRLDQ